MSNQKKTSGNLSSKACLLNTHTSLVFAASEERKVYESLLKLVIERINASTALMQWAKMESNTAVKNAICSLYDINLMWSSVQREFAEETKRFGLALNEILQVEAGLDAIRMQIKEITEKKEKLIKFINDSNRKKFEILKISPTDNDLNKLEEDIIEAKSELEAKTLQAEVFKNTVLKKSLLSVMNSHVMLAQKSQCIFSTAKMIIEEIPEVPIHLKDSGNKIPSAEVGISGEEHINNLAKALNLEHRSKVHMDSISSSHTLEHPSRQSNKLVELLNEKRFSSSFLTPNLSSSKLQPSHLTIPDPTSRARSQTTTALLTSPSGYINSKHPEYVNDVKSNNNSNLESDCYVQPNNFVLYRSCSDPMMKIKADDVDGNFTDSANSSYYLFDSDDEPFYDGHSHDEPFYDVPSFDSEETSNSSISSENETELVTQYKNKLFKVKEDGGSDANLSSLNKNNSPEKNDDPNTPNKKSGVSKVLRRLPNIRPRVNTEPIMELKNDSSLTSSYIKGPRPAPRHKNIGTFPKQKNVIEENNIILMQETPKHNGNTIPLNGLNNLA